MDDRDDQKCAECDLPLGRKVAFTGWVWHPTSSDAK